MEPWEALDVDDSDHPSLLQPCNRLRQSRRKPNSSAAASSQPPLTFCSGPTPISEDKNISSLQQPDQNPLPPPPPPRRIPGPAGIVQAAMLQKNFDRGNHDSSSSQVVDPISTQEYVRKAVEDSSEFDCDFNSNAWLCALQYIREVPGITTLKSITSSMLRIQKVVAVIKSSRPNGLGGLMVTLKDPTGTIGASVPPKVLSESRFGKNIIVGAVLVLKEVAIFAPSRTAVYLNITLRNLEKVFCKDSDPPPENAVRFSDPGIDYSGSAEKEMTEETLDAISQCMRSQGFVHSEIEMEKENLLQNLRQDAMEKEPSNVRNASKGVAEIIKMVTTRDKSKNDSHVCNTTESSPKRHKTQETDDFMRKMQPFVSKAPLPEWTDEQLNQLFVCDDLDDSHGRNTTESLHKSHTFHEEVQERDDVLRKTQALVSKTPLPEWTDEQLSELFAGDDMDF